MTAEVSLGKKIPSKITIPPGTTLNLGVHEDSDSVVVKEELRLPVVGTAPGSLLVSFQDEVFHYHQPEQPRKK